MTMLLRILYDPLAYTHASWLQALGLDPSPALRPAANRLLIHTLGLPLQASLSHDDALVQSHVISRWHLLREAFGLLGALAYRPLLMQHIEALARPIQRFIRTPILFPAALTCPAMHLADAIEPDALSACGQHLARDWIRQWPVALARRLPLLSPHIWHTREHDPPAFFPPPLPPHIVIPAMTLALHHVENA